MTANVGAGGYAESPGVGPAGSDGVDDSFISEIMVNLSTIGSREQWYRWRNELFNQQTVNFRNKAAVRAWHESIYRQHGPHLVGRSLCTLRWPLYHAGRASQELPLSSSIRCHGSFCANR